MARSIFSMVPNAEDLLIMEPEEIAGVILSYIHSLSGQEKLQLNRHNFSLRYTYQEYLTRITSKSRKYCWRAGYGQRARDSLPPKQGIGIFSLEEALMLSSRRCGSLYKGEPLAQKA